MCTPGARARKLPAAAGFSPRCVDAKSSCVRSARWLITICACHTTLIGRCMPKVKKQPGHAGCKHAGAPACGYKLALAD